MVGQGRERWEGLGLGLVLTRRNHRFMQTPDTHRPSTTTNNIKGRGGGDSNGGSYNGNGGGGAAGNGGDGGNGRKRHDVQKLEPF